MKRLLKKIIVKSVKGIFYIIKLPFKFVLFVTGWMVDPLVNKIVKFDNKFFPPEKTKEEYYKENYDKL